MKIASTKNWALVAALACSPVISLAANAATPIPQTAKKSTVTFKNDEEKAGYIIGHQFSSSINSTDFKIDKKAILKAIEEGLNGKKSELSEKESQEFMQKYLSDQQKIIGDKNQKAGEEFLNKNKKEKGVVTLPSGLQYKIVSEGKGGKPKLTDTVTVNYEGTLIDGKVFDSSYQRGQPATFPVNGVIKGWTEALQLMPEGSTWMLYIPASLAYGAQAPSPNIGPNSTLVFKVNLVSIAKPAAQAPAKANENVKK